MTNLSQLKEKVRGILISKFGSATEGSQGRFMFPYESTSAFVELGTWNESPVVKVFAPVSSNVEISEKLALRIISEETGNFGEWEVWDYDASTNKGFLVISQILLGETLDDIELFLALGLIVHAANNASNWVASDFGGTKFNNG
jgi:hypothetical protein